MAAGARRITYAGAVVALTVALVFANVAFITASIRAYFIDNDIRYQIAAYVQRGTTIEDAAMGEFYTRSICPTHAADPACAGPPEGRADLVHRLCADKIIEVTHGEFGPPDETGARSISDDRYCQFAAPDLSGWLSDARPGLMAEVYLLILVYAELGVIGLAWGRWRRLGQRIALLAGMALSLAAYFLVSDQYSVVMHDIVATAVLALDFAVVWIVGRLVR